VRVAILLEQLLGPVPGGTGRYSRELAAALGEHARRAAPSATLTGWVAAHRDVSAALVPGVAGPRRLPLPLPLLNRLAGLGRGPGPRRADVVLAPTMLVPPRRRTPLVVTLHDLVPWTHPETMTPHGARWHRAIGERVARTADAVLVPTRAVAAELPRWLPALDAARVHVTGEGTSAAVTTLPADVGGRARALGLPGRYLLSVATLEPRKGLDVALRALADLPPDLPLLLAGQPGWGGVDPLAEARGLGLDPGRVRLLGRLDDADLAVALAGAAAVLVPSRAEGFGLPVVEAMALGTPVVISDAPALVEVAGGAAEVAPVGDPVALAAATLRAADPAVRAERAARGRARAAEHTWAAAAAATWAVLADAAARGAHPAATPRDPGVRGRPPA